MAPLRAPDLRTLSAAASTVSLPTVFRAPLAAAVMTSLAETVAVVLAPVYAASPARLVPAVGPVAATNPAVTIASETMGATASIMSCPAPISNPNTFATSLDCALFSAIIWSPALPQSASAAAATPNIMLVNPSYALLPTPFALCISELKSTSDLNFSKIATWLKPFCSPSIRASIQSSVNLSSA